MKLTDIYEVNVAIGSEMDSNVTVDNDIKNDEVTQQLLKDLKIASQRSGVKVRITTAKSDHNVKTTSGNVSRHSTNDAVDISRLNGIGSNGATNSINGNSEFRKYGNKLKDELVKLGYTWNSEKGNPKAVLWQTDIGGNHYNHLHVSNKDGSIPSGDYGGDSSGDDDSSDELTKSLLSISTRFNDLTK